MDGEPRRLKNGQIAPNGPIWQAIVLPTYLEMMLAVLIMQIKTTAFAFAVHRGNVDQNLHIATSCTYATPPLHLQLHLQELAETSKTWQIVNSLQQQDRFVNGRIPDANNGAPAAEDALCTGIVPWEGALGVDRNENEARNSGARDIAGRGQGGLRFLESVKTITTFGCMNDATLERALKNAEEIWAELHLQYAKIKPFVN